MVNEYCGFCDDAFSTLLDAYQMKDWNISWKEFVLQAAKEFKNAVEKWKNEPIGMEE